MKDAALHTAFTNTKNKLALRKRLGSNPIFLKELRSRMRGGRAFVVLTIYLALVSALVGLIYISYTMTSESPYDPGLRQTMGKAIFGVVIVMQLALVGFQVFEV